MDKKEGKQGSIQFIYLDSYVALRIIKYSREAKMGHSGGLLGMCSENSLHINNSFPLPKLSISREETKEAYEIAAEIEKQAEVGNRIMEQMKYVCGDFTNIGWYQSTLLGDYINEDTLKYQFQLQTQLPACICIIFDLSLANQSLKCFKAIRLTSYAMQILSSLPPEQAEQQYIILQIF